MWVVYYFISLQTNTIASLRYLAAHGHTVVLLNCEDIEESFYDLFNQNFSSIDQSDGTKKYYANIAMGAQMRICYVDPKFQCIVVIKEGQVKNTPGPYLNRFEKYSFTHKSVLEDIILTLPKPIATIIQNIRTEVSNLLLIFNAYYIIYMSFRSSIWLTVLMKEVSMGSVMRQ